MPIKHESPDEYFSSDAERSAAEKSKEQQPKKVDRRVAMAELGVMMAPFAMYMRSIFGGTSKERPETNEHYDLTDAGHPLQNGKGSYRNLGIYHTQEALERDQKHIAAAIDEADIVLLEGGQDSDEVNYFSQLRDYAKKKGKTIYDIDDKRMGLIEVQQGLAIGIPGAIGVAGAVDDLKWADKPDMQITRKGSRRNFLRGIAAVGAAAYIPTHVPTGDAKQYPAYDITYIADGRTVKMLTSVHEIAALNPDKKIVSITGNMHALGIEHYLAHDDQYQAKKAVYDVTYEPLYGKDKKKITD